MPEISIEMNSNTPSFSMTDKRNLVLAGGGVKGIAYVGVRAALEAFGFPLNEIERVGGTSAGAINAMAFALNLSAEQTKQLLLDLNVGNLLDNSTNINCCFFQAKRPVRVLSELHNNFGIYPGEFARKWLESVVYNSTKIHFCTFGELRELRSTTHPEYKDLYMVGFNANTGLAQTFSAETTPDAIISDAIRVSMSIPWLYQPHRPYYKVKGKRQESRYDIALLSIDPDLSPQAMESFNTTNTLLPGVKHKKPTLIQYGSDYWFYGNTDGKYWKLTRLDSQKIGGMMSDSKIVFSEKILLNPQSILLCDYITSIKAHTHKYYFVDGGLVENYPITLFDTGQYASERGMQKNAAYINPQTLGFYLAPSDKLAYLNDRIDDDSDIETAPEHDITEFESFTRSVVSGVYNRDYNVAVREHENQRTIYIDDCNIDATDFNLDNAHKQLLLRSGWNSVCKAYGRDIPVPDWLTSIPDDKCTEQKPENTVCCSIS